MSLISPVGRDLAMVYPPLAPVRLMEILADRDIGVIPVDGEEYETNGLQRPGRPSRTGLAIFDHR